MCVFSISLDITGIDYGLVFTLGVSLVAFTVSLFSLHVARQANSLPILVDLFREWRSEEFYAHRSYIRDRLPPDPCPLTRLDPESLSHARPLSHLLDNLGLLVKEGLVSERVILCFLGESIKYSWERLAPFIERERKEIREDEEYQEYFEDLAARAQSKNLPRLRGNLRKYKAARLDADTSSRV